MNSDTLDWSLCRTFLRILSTGSLSAAGRELGLAHPTVRRHLEQLEQALGGALFTRSQSGLRPTPLALRIEPAGRAMEAAAEAVRRAAHPVANAEPAGTVRIAASHVMGVEVLPPILASLRATHPGLTVELSLSDRTENVLQRDVDVAVRMVRPAQDRLLGRKIGTVALGFFAHERWLAVHTTPLTTADLTSSGWLIGQDRDTSLRDGLAAAGIAMDRNRIGFRSDSDLAQLAALRAGAGIGVVQLPIAGRDPALVRVLPQFSAELEMWLVTHPDLRADSRIAATLDHLRAGLKRYLGAG